MKRSSNIRQYPIRFKLVALFLSTAVFVALINVTLYFNLQNAISKIDTVYISNEFMNELVDTLKLVQNNIYEYLSTKSTKALEDYYRYEQDYNSLIKRLNHDTVGDSTALMEKNIYYMSLTYLKQANGTVEAKRARNIPRYKAAYEEIKQLYDDIDTIIHNLNNTQFRNNSEKYIQLRSSLNYLVLMSAVILFIILVLNILFIIVMTRSITSPIAHLAQISNQVAQGNFDIDVPYVETKDELGMLSGAFCKMVESIRNYIGQVKDNYERENKMKENELIMETNLKDAQLKYLQAQINPHFLFNTLNAGAQLAMMEGAEKTCVFVQNMADFFRYNVRKIDTDTSLGEEIDLVDNYIYILNVRFSGEIHFHKQIDSRLLETRVPSMILQPIVENAVNHGIRGIERQGNICLKVCQEREEVCVSILDNGVGISGDTIHRILHGEDIHETAGKDTSGIGLDNVISRLRGYYNKEHIIDIKSEGGGTEIILYIPLRT